jgi:hypothetical protein
MHRFEKPIWTDGRIVTSGQEVQGSLTVQDDPTNLPQEQLAEYIDAGCALCQGMSGGMSGGDGPTGEAFGSN